MKRKFFSLLMASGLLYGCDENIADYGNPKLTALTSDTLTALVGSRPTVNLNVSAGNGAKYITVFKDGSLEERLDIDASASTFKYEGNVENDTTFFSLGFILTNLNGTNSSLVTIPVKVTLN